MDADGSILRRDARFLREFAELAILEIYDLQRIAIFRFEIGEKPRDALANFLAESRRGLFTFREFPSPDLHRSCRGGPVAVVIDHGVAKDAVEPGHYFFILNTGASLQSAGKRRLQNIFGHCPGLDPPFQKCQKLPVA